MTQRSLLTKVLPVFAAILLNQYMLINAGILGLILNFYYLNLHIVTKVNNLKGL